MEKVLNQYTIDEAVNLVVDGYRNVSSHADYNATERAEGSRLLLSELAKDYRNNKNQIFAIIERVITEVLPERLRETIGRFAEVEQFAEGDKPRFHVKSGKITAFSVALGGFLN